MSVAGFEVHAGSRAYRWSRRRTRHLTLPSYAKLPCPTRFATSATVAPIASNVDACSGAVGFIVEAGALTVDTDLGATAAIATLAAVVWVALQVGADPRAVVLSARTGNRTLAISTHLTGLTRCTTRSTVSPIVESINTLTRAVGQPALTAYRALPCGAYLAGLARCTTRATVSPVLLG